MSSGGVWLSDETLASADAITGNFSNLLVGESYTGELSYYSLCDDPRERRANTARSR